MILCKAIRNRHYFNSFLNAVAITNSISPNSSNCIHHSSISLRPFSRSPQSSHTPNGNIPNSAEPLSCFFRRVIGAGDSNNRVVPESAQLNNELSNLDEDVRGVSDRLRKLEEELRSLNKNIGEKVKTLHPEKKEKRSLWALFSEKRNEQSESKPTSKLKTESQSAPERSAYGLEDTTVYRELSSDMKMLVEHLYGKGYFRDANFIPRDKFDPSCFEISYAREFLKFAAVNFGNDHQEIAGWLSAGDLKKVALFGCPSLGQKTVFSAKHMRKFFKIDEQKVCETCKLKKLCSYPNKSSKKPATKLDMASVMKVLLMYAMESVPRSLAVPEEVKYSVSRLLKEVISLSQDT